MRQSDAVLPKGIVDPALGGRVACDARKQPSARRGIEPTMVLPANARKSWFLVPVARKQLYGTRTRIDHICEIARSGAVCSNIPTAGRFETDICAKIGAKQIVGSIPRCTLDYFRASQATHPPSSGIALHHNPIFPDASFSLRSYHQSPLTKFPRQPFQDPSKHLGIILGPCQHQRSFDRE